MNTTEKGMFFASGTDTAAVTIPPSIGQIVCTRLGWDGPAAGTLGIYRPDVKGRANAAVSAASTLVIKTDAAGYVEGFTPTTDDYVLVQNSTSGGTAWYLQKISSVAAVSSSTRSLGLAGNVTCLADDFVYICRAANIVTMAVASESVRNLYDAFCSFRGHPVHLLQAATGANRVFGSFDVMD